jgi:hypothetical protein
MSFEDILASFDLLSLTSTENWLDGISLTGNRRDIRIDRM